MHEMEDEAAQLVEPTDDPKLVPAAANGVVLDEEQLVNLNIITPLNKVIALHAISPSEMISNIKQSLLEMVDTCSFTAYHFVYEGEEEEHHGVILNDFVEILAYPFLEGTATIRMVLEPYDVKKARFHVRRFKDLLLFPPAERVIIEDEKDAEVAAAGEDESVDVTQDDEAAELTKRWKKALEQRIATNKLLREKLGESEVETSASLSEFYDKTLHVFSEHPVDTSTIPCLREITYSAWNPPPSNRKLQGELLYLQVHTLDDGILHITCTQSGFFVNRTSHSLFDPQPAAICHFSHELLYTLLSASPSFLKAWSQALENANEAQRREINPILNISSAVTSGHLESSFVKAPWLVPATNGSLRAHAADASRAEDDLLDGFGLDDKGSSREWHDDLQSVRDMKPQSANEKLMKQRFIYKTYVEFTESCKLAAVAIVDGYIAPMNPQDSDRAHVYIYNNIFFSRANDANDTLRVFYGDNASRKSAGSDLINQKFIQAIGVEGLNTVMTTIVDYKGQRLIGQSLLPGILQHGRSGARLMYGALDASAKIKCKSAFHACMKELGTRVRIAERMISTTPYDKEAFVHPPAEGFEAKGVDPGRLRSAGDGLQSTTMILDDNDEISPDENGCVPFIGPVECKGIEGSDGRLYLLEITRLAPRDANFLSSSQGGTSVYTDAQLEWIEPGMAPTLVLRPELVTVWTHHTLKAFRSKTLQELGFFDTIHVGSNTEEEKSVASTPEAATILVESREEVPSAVVSSEDLEVAQTENVRDVEATKLKQRQMAILEQLREKEARFMSTQLLNVNVFTPYHSGQSGVEREADEQLAREIALYLANQVLHEITEEVRVRSFVPLDGAYLTQILHSRGVNIRYLGRLAVMALEVEKRDAELETMNLQRPFPMPRYWLELLETEIIARVAKHVLGSHLRSDVIAPVQTIAAFLNGLLGDPDADDTLTQINGHVASKPTGKAAQGKKALKKAKKAGFSAMLSALTLAEYPNLYSDTPLETAVWSDIIAGAKSRFCYELKLFGPLADSSLKWRVSKLALLRRVSQQCGIQLLGRSFNFCLRRPFFVKDIVNCLPVVKSSIPLVPCEDVREALEQVHAHLEQGNIRNAFDIAHAASAMVQHVCGAFHPDVTRCLETLAEVLMRADDLDSATTMLQKALGVHLQATGLDTHHTVTLHEMLAKILHKTGHTDVAVKHMHAAQYIRNVCVGPRHVGLLEGHHEMAMMYEEIQHHSMAMKHLQYVLAQSAEMDKLSVAQVYHSLSTTLGSMKQFREAVASEREAYSLFKSICGEDDPRTRKTHDCLQSWTKQAVDVAVKEKEVLKDIAAAMAEDADRNKENGPSEELGADVDTGTAIDEDKGFRTVKKKKPKKKK